MDGRRDLKREVRRRRLVDCAPLAGRRRATDALHITMSDAADAKRQRKAPPPKDSAAPSRLDPDYIGRAVRVLEEETGKYRRLKLLRYLGSDRRSLEVQAELDPTAGAAQEKPFRLELGGPQIYVASDVVWGCPPVEDGAEDAAAAEVVDAAAMETDPDRLVPLVLFVPLEPDDDGGLGGDGEQLAQYLDSGDHAFIDPARTRPFVAHMWRRITRAPMRKAVAAAVEHVRALWSPALERGKKAFVGKRIAVYWPDDDAWYTGSIQSYDGKEGKHSVMYDDGIDEMLKLSDEVAYVLDDAAAEEAVAAYSAVGKCMYCGKLGKLCDKNSPARPPTSPPPTRRPARPTASRRPRAPGARSGGGGRAHGGGGRGREGGGGGRGGGGGGRRRPGPGRFETPGGRAAPPPPAATARWRSTATVRRRRWGGMRRRRRRRRRRRGRRRRRAATRGAGGGGGRGGRPAGATPHRLLGARTRRRRRAAAGRRGDRGGEARRQRPRGREARPRRRRRPSGEAAGRGAKVWDAAVRGVPRPRAHQVPREADVRAAARRVGGVEVPRVQDVRGVQGGRHQDPTRHVRRM